MTCHNFGGIIEEGRKGDLALAVTSPICAGSDKPQGW